MDEIIISEVIDGIPLNLRSSRGLFSKYRIDLGTRLFLENIILPEEGNVVDVGCGYGPIGIFIAKKNPKLKVYMVDIDPLAIKYAKINSEINKVSDRVIVVKSDVLRNVPKIGFNAIYSNPPLLKGKKFLYDLIQQSFEYLNKNGFLQIVLYKGEENALKIMKEIFGNSKILKRSKGYAIILSVKN
jgi:16S rRNA G1207 methylase RsmC